MSRKIGFIKVSRSAVGTRKNCEMRRYYAYEEDGIGYSPKPTASSELSKERGKIFHELGEVAAGGGEWQKSLPGLMDRIPREYRNQQEILIRRAFMGWEIIRGPFYRDNFTVQSTEQEWIWELGGINMPFRMDRILRRNDDGSLGIFDFKTLGSVDPNWIERLSNSDQTHLYIQGLKERSGEFVLGMIYEGIIIGKMKDGQQMSPFVLAYETPTGKITPKWAQGYKRVDMTTYSDEQWLKWAQGTGILMDLYCTSGFVNPPPSSLLMTKNATAAAELDWADKMWKLEELAETYGKNSLEYQMVFSQLVERNSDHCLKYGIGHACPYYGRCWRGEQLDLSVFDVRIDHHAGEGEDSSEED